MPLLNQTYTCEAKLFYDKLFTVRHIPQLKHPIQHLLMDLDGTLIHSGGFWVQLEFIRRVLPMISRKKGLRAAWNTLKESQNVTRVHSREKTIHTRTVEVFKKHLDLNFEDAEKNLSSSLMKVFPKLKRHFGQIDGAASFVEWAKPRYSLTLATNPVWKLELVHLRMRWGGIDPNYFNSVTTSDRMHGTKPSREYFEEILEQEKFDARDCLFIGNERKMDLPATKVGIPVFLIRPEAKEVTCILQPGPSEPGAWRGTYQHLQELLAAQKSTL
jgi:FMN phosphatase YigB (HAD superfamily)